MFCSCLAKRRVSVSPFPLSLIRALGGGFGSASKIPVMKNVTYEIKEGGVAVVTINRPERRNAVDQTTSQELRAAFLHFDADETLSAAVLTGAGGNFCAGYDLQFLAKANNSSDMRREQNLGSGPMGPTHLHLSKPVIAAVEGYAVAGGLELAVWSDIRIASSDAVFGVFCRRFGVPLIDGGTVRLPRLIGQSRASDMILSGRPVGADEALQFGLANRVVDPGSCVSEAIKYAQALSKHPQLCLRKDREMMHRQWDLSLEESLKVEGHEGSNADIIEEAIGGAEVFSSGRGRQGDSLHE